MSYLTYLLTHLLNLKPFNLVFTCDSLKNPFYFLFETCRNTFLCKIIPLCLISLQKLQEHYHLTRVFQILYFQQKDESSRRVHHSLREKTENYVIKEPYTLKLLTLKLINDRRDLPVWYITQTRNHLLVHRFTTRLRLDRLPLIYDTL